jgi:hypothetical protein
MAETEGELEREGPGVGPSRLTYGLTTRFGWRRQK